MARKKRKAKRSGRGRETKAGAPRDLLPQDPKDPDDAPSVERYGELHVLRRTRFGRVHIIKLQDGYLLAAEHPPEGESLDVDLGPFLSEHLMKTNLRPWKRIEACSLGEAIRSLDDERARAPEKADDSWSPFLVPLDSGAVLVGEARERLVERVAWFTSARRRGDPLAQIVGVRGVGKRTVARDLFRRRGLRSVVELPLARVLAERILSTPLELFIDTIIAAAEKLGEEDMLVVSDGELMDCMPREAQRYCLQELSRLPHALLLALPSERTPAGLVPFHCPGLVPSDMKTIRRLLELEHPRVEFVGTALELLMRGANLRGTGVVPARLLLALRLCTAMISAKPGRPLRVAPDEVTVALNLAACGWANPTTERQE